MTRGLVIAFGFFSSVAIGQSRQPEPSKIYTQNGISVKAYDFKAFKYFLEQANDTVYIVNFWATWCTPCVAELPSFEKLRSVYAARKVKVILVSLDFQKQVETNLIPFIERKKLQSDVVLLSDPDGNSWIEKVDKQWSGAIPATIIYSKNKRNFYERSFDYASLEKELESFIH